jgi:predicted nuclease of predicted toxin-antitoxin system
VKLLLDTCVSGNATEELLARGHDVIWAGSWPEDPGDVEILARAFAEGRVLVTLDKDFGELAIFKGQKHAGIIRLVNIPAKAQAEYVGYILDTHEDVLSKAAIVTAERSRLRVRLGDGSA